MSSSRNTQPQASPAPPASAETGKSLFWLQNSPIDQSLDPVDLLHLRASCAVLRGEPDDDGIIFIIQNHR